jgi:hypothetical protein
MSPVGQWQPISRVRAQPGGHYELLFIDRNNQICTMTVTGLELTELSPTIEPLAARLTQPAPETVQWLGTVLWDYVRGRVVRRARPADPVLWADIGRTPTGEPRVRYRPRNGEQK